MKTSAKPDTGFLDDADKYAAYLKTPEGRLRLDLTFANLQEFLPMRRSNNSMCALDLGCGTGATAVRLAHLSVHVTMLDSSRAMLDIAKRAASEAGVGDQVTLKQSDVTELSTLFNVGSFDMILCHNLLEYVDNPGAVLPGAARLMRGAGGNIAHPRAPSGRRSVKGSDSKRRFGCSRKRPHRGLGRGISVRRQGALVLLTFSRSDVEGGVAAHDRSAWSAHCCRLPAPANFP
jgi:SAM-dependent methyltransferase